LEGLKVIGFSDNLDVDVRIILKCENNSKEIRGVNWSHLVQNSDRLQALVNTAVNLRVPYEA
jgi:hypothetical protein